MKNASTHRTVASENSRYTAKALVLAAIAAAAVTSLGSVVRGDIYENTGNPANLLNTAAAWNDLTLPPTHPAPPSLADTAQWDAGSNIVTPTSFSLGGSMSWTSIVVSSVGADVTVLNDGSNNMTLTNGIDMSAAAHNFSFLDLMSLSGTQNYNVAANRTLSLGAIVLNGSTLNLIGDGNFALTGIVSSGSGAGGVVKNGNGTVTMSANNTYTGSFTLSCGTLDVNIAGGLGAAGATFIINGGTIDNTSNASVTVNGDTGGSAQKWNGNFTFGGTNSLSLGTGNPTMTTNVTLTALGNTTLTVGGGIAGTGFSFDKTGVGTVVLAGSDTYSGNTTVDGGLLQQNLPNANAILAGSQIFLNATGTLAIPNDAALGTLGSAEPIIFQGGTLRFNSFTSAQNFTNISNLALGAANGTSTLGNLTAGNGLITGSKGLIYNGPGSLILAANNSFSGQTVVNAGTLIQNLPDNNSNITINAGAYFGIPNDAALGTEQITWNTGTLQFDNYNTSLNFANITNLALGAANGTPSNFNGNITGTQGLVYNGPGSLILTTAQLYSGNTTVNNGVLVQSFADNNSNIVLNAPGALAIFNDLAVGNETIAFNGGSLQLNNYPSNLNFVDKGLVTLGANAGLFSTLLGNLQGNTTFTFAGPGTLLLAGNNTYNGNTTIQGGTLAFSNLAQLGTGNIINFTGGTLQYTPGNTVDITTHNVIVSNTTTGTGGTIDINGNNISFNNAVSGNGSLSVIDSQSLNSNHSLTINAVQTYTGATGVGSGATLRLNAANGSVLAGGPLILSGGTLDMDIGASALNVTQAFSATTINAGRSFMIAPHTGAGIPTVSLGAITINPGAEVEFIGPATINGSGNVTATANFSTTSGTANTVLLSPNSSASFAKDIGYATVGLYDFAAKDSGNVNIIGGSQIPGFYTAWLAQAGSQTIAGNADIGQESVAANGTITGVTNHNTDGPAIVRFNGTAETIYTQTAITDTNAILVTPNIGPHLVIINGVTGDIEAHRGDTNPAIALIQNDVLGALDIRTGISNTASGATSVVKSGDGLLLMAASSFTGPVYLDAGVYEVPSNAGLGAPASAGALFLAGGSLLSNATFTMDNGAGANPRPVTLLNGGGTLAALTNTALTVNGVISGNGGTLFVGLGQIVGTGNGTAFPTALFGNGTIIMKGANTYTGNTTILNHATLQMDAPAGTGLVTVGSLDGTNTGTLTGAAVSASNVLVNSGSTLFPGDSGNGTLTLGSLALGSTGAISGGGIIDFSLSGASATTDPITIVSNGTLTLNGINSVNLFGVGGTAPKSGSGTYNLIALGTSGVVGSVSNTTLVVADPLPRTTYTFQVASGELQVVIASALVNGIWNGSLEPGNTNWSGSGAANWAGSLVPGGASDQATFPGTLGNTTQTVTLNANETVGTLTVNTANLTNPILAPTMYNFVGTGSTSLTLNNTGNTASISAGGGTTTFAVPITITAPGAAILATNDVGANLTSVVQVSGPISGSGNFSVSGTGQVILSGNNSYTGTTTIAVGSSLQIGAGGSSGTFGAGDVSANGSLTVNRADGVVGSPVVIGNNITGSGSLTVNGTGVTELTGNNTFTGQITINAGRLQVGSSLANTTFTSLGSGIATTVVVVGANGTLDLNGISLTKGSVSGAGTIDNSSATPATLTGGSGGLNDTISGNITNTGTGNLSIAYNASTKQNTLILSGNNTYRGNTTILNGVIRLNNNTAAGTGTLIDNGASTSVFQLAGGVVITNNVIANGNLAGEFEDVPDAGTSATLAGATSVSGPAQYRLGTSSTTSTIIMTGTSAMGGSPIVFLTRNNVVFMGNGSLSTAGSGINLGRSAQSDSLNLVMNDNSFLSGVGISLGGAGSNNADDINTNVTLNGNSSLRATTGAFNLDSGSSGLGANVNLTMNNNSFINGTGIVAGGTNQGTITLAFNGGSIIGTGGDTPTALFFPASFNNGTNAPNIPTATIQTGGLTLNDGGFKETYAVSFGGTGGLTKTGTGTVILTGANVYSGDTTVAAGTLFADDRSSTIAAGLGSVHVLANGTFGGSGIVNGNINVDSGGHIAAGDSAVIGTLSLGNGGSLQNVNLANNTFIDVNFKPDGTANSRIDLPLGGLFVNDPGDTVGYTFVQAGSTTPFDINGTYPLWTDDVGFADSGETSVVVNPQGGTVTYTFGNDGASKTVTISGGNNSVVWGVNASGTWGTNTNWIAPIVPNAVGDVATFGSAITSNQTVTLTSNKTVGNIYFNNAAASYTIASGGGNLTLDNGVGGTSSTATSNITVANGTHTMAIPINVNSLNLNLIVTNAADSLSLTQAVSGATGNVTYTGAGKLVLSGANTFTGKLILAGSGNVTLTGSDATTQVLSITGNSNVSLAAASTFGGINKGGNGTLVVSTPELYSNSTNVTGGTVQLVGSGTLGNGTSALALSNTTVLDLNGVSLTVGSLSGTGSVDAAVAGGSGTTVLTTGSLNTSTTFGNTNLGTLRNTTGSLALVKVGTGTLTLAGTNTYTGGTTLSGGGLAVGADNNLGAANGSLTFNGGTLVPGSGYTSFPAARPVNWSPAGGGINVAANGATFIMNRDMVGGGFTKTGPGTVDFQANYTTSSPTVISAGTLRLTSGTFSSGPITNNGTLAFNRGSSNMTISSNITGTGGITQLGTGTVTLAGTISSGTLGTPIGLVNVANGTLQLGDVTGCRQQPSDVVDISNLTLATGATLDIGNRDLIIRNGNYNAVTALVAQGFGVNEDWTGTGITSNDAANNGTAIGVGVAGDLGYSSFDGVPVNPGDILVKYTFFGDADLNGMVNGDDFTLFQIGSGSLASDHFGWELGDFDYANGINGDDFTLFQIGSGSGTGTGPNGPLVSSHSSVPEPTSLMLLGLGAAGLLTRRRRHA